MTTLTEDLQHSPISSTVDKLWESWYFILMMLQNYHDPHAFRYNLNAFIQALRNITFMLQSEEKKPEKFDAWYRDKQEAMRANQLLRRFVDARNMVVKKQMLATASFARLGLFRDRKFKLGVGGDVDPFVDSRDYLSKATSFMVGFFLDLEHSAIGEQIGVYRQWSTDAIGEGEVTRHCISALDEMAIIVQEAHTLLGVEFDASFKIPSIENSQVLLESDVDPSLPVKWGWVSPGSSYFGTARESDE